MITAEGKEVNSTADKQERLQLVATMKAKLRRHEKQKIKRKYFCYMILGAVGLAVSASTYTYFHNKFFN
uniref:Coiled-coil_56 domain-containing protein n=1 Tax=Rhabditophanes sp. KR3021 TaxID=114890 RepID=A0AC35TMD0_9BILA